MNPSQRVSRACDSCRIRKVKCDTSDPCSQCVHFNLPCIFSPSAGRRKNPVRGRLVAMARGDSGEWANDRGHLVSTPSDSTLPTGTSPGSPSKSSITSTTYDREFFISLLPQFEQIVYPVNPVVSPQDIHAAINNVENNLEDRALVYAFAAVTIFLNERSDDISGLDMARMDELMQQSLEAHNRADLQVGPDGHMIEEPRISIKRVMTCIFLEISMMAFKRFSRSFVLLREAITMIDILQVDKNAGSGPEAASYQRLYWEAYIHERFLTIASGYPSVMQPLQSGFPTSDPSLPPYIELGFNRLIALFLIMDEPFLAYWQRPQQQSEKITPEWIETKQTQLDEDEAAATEADNELQNNRRGALTELQHADLFITRLWLRILVWQLALSRGLLRSSPPENVHEGLSLNFPAKRLATQLRGLVCRLSSLASIGTQGSGIVQKLFEITSTIADVLALPLGLDRADEQTSAHVEDFIFLVKFIFQFERIREQQKAYLRDKIDILRQLYPEVNNTDL